MRRDLRATAMCAIGRRYVAGALLLCLWPEHARSDVAFSAPFQSFASAGQSYSLALADFNGDGRLDVATVARNTGLVSVALGNGDGTLGLRLDEPAGTAPTAIAAGDLNGDGIADAVVGAQNGLLLFYGGGDATLSGATSLLSGESVIAVGICDVGHDGKSDVVAVTASGDVVVFSGHGDGTFAQPRSSFVGAAPQAAKCTDLNGDGFCDVAVVCRPSPVEAAVLIMLGSGDGTLTAPTTYPVSPGAVALATGDVNSDGMQDIVVGCGDHVAILLGNGDGAFVQGLSANVYSPAGLAIADVNSDGAADMICAQSTGASVAVSLGNGNGTFRDPVAYPTCPSPYPVAIADLNADGSPDIVVAGSQQSSSVSTLLGNGRGSFGLDNGYPAGGSSGGVVAADLDSDGRVDICAVDPASGMVSIVLEQTDGTLVSAPALHGGPNPIAVTANDVDRDGHVDLVVVNAGTGPIYQGSVTIFSGHGDGTFDSGVAYAVGHFPSSVAVADMNRDGAPDVLVTNYLDNSVSVLLGRGDGTFEPKVDYAAGPRPSAIAVADFDEDGWADVAVTNAGPQSLSILLGQPGGGLAAPVAQLLGPTLTTLACADLDHDNHWDIVAGGNLVSRLYVLTGLGNGNFRPATAYDSGGPPTDIAAGDLDGDGSVDVGFTDATNQTVSVMFGSQGRLGAVHMFGTKNPPGALSIADANGDGEPDLVVENSGVISVRYNLARGQIVATRLLTFSASRNGSTVTIAWSLAEKPVAALLLERSQSRAGPWTTVDIVRSQVGAVVDHGAVTVDSTYYRLRGDAVVGVTYALPAAVRSEGLLTALPSIGPGPFALTFASERPCTARIDVFDVSGRAVSRIDAPSVAGTTTANWMPPRGSRPGVYLIRVTGSRTVAFTRVSLIE